MHSGRCRAALMLCALLGAGCTGLPPTPKPVVLQPTAPVSDLPSGGGDWPHEQWWLRYQDATLDRLIETALRGSPSLGAAHARFESARQSVRIASAAAGARVQASGDITRQRLSDNGLFPPALLGFTWYNQEDLGLKASYTFDWWGKQRDLVLGAMDEAHAAQAERTAAALVLASSVADSYFGWQGDQARLALAREHEQTVASAEAIARARMDADVDSKDELDRAAGALAGVRGEIAALQGSASLRVVALAALAGVSPGELPELAPKPLPHIDGALPDDVRIDLIARRPDITASRWRVLAAEKGRESARAEFFPDFSINALVGVESITTQKLLQYGSRVPSVGAALHLPLFDGGRLKAQYGAADSAVNSAVANYSETLVAAAREVATQATTLASIAAEREQRGVELEAAAARKASAAARVAQGLVDPRAELAASESLLEQQDALVQLDAAAVSANIGLTRALGGGFDATGAFQ